MSNPEFIPVNIPDLSGNEKKYLNECIDTEWISSVGPFVKKFEKGMADYIGRKYAVSVTNGSHALDLAIAALELEEGSEIIVPSFSIISCAQSIVYNKCVPVLIDSDMHTCNMKVEELESVRTEKTKAIMVVHTYGFPVDMDPVFEFAKKYNLRIIEDAAEMHGQKYKGRNCGTLGDISTFSFYPNKHITTGEGGMVMTDDTELYERCALLKNLAFTKERFIHERLGWNMRMTNLQAALGVAQLERVDQFVAKKREAGRYYTEKLQSLIGDKAILPLEKTDYAENVYWVYPILLKDNVKLNAREVEKLFIPHRVQTRPYFYAMHLQPVFHKMGLYTGKEEHLKNAEKLSFRGFYIPMGTAITKAQQDRVIEVVAEVFKQL